MCGFVWVFSYRTDNQMDMDCSNSHLIWPSIVSGEVPINVMAESFRPISFNE